MALVNAWSAVNSWGGGGHTRKVEITGASAPASTLTGYVALITEANLPSEIWTTALNGGGDLRVCTDSAGTDQLPLEVVSFDTVAETAVLWVRFASYSSAARALWLFYGKAGESQPTPSSTYGSQSVWQDFEYSFHFSAGDTTTDSSGNYSLSAFGTISEINDNIGDGGVSYSESSSNYHTVTGCKGVLGNAARTVSHWFLATTDNLGLFESGQSGSGTRYSVRVDRATGVAGGYRTEIQGTYAVTTDTFHDSSWHLGVSRVDGGTGFPSAYSAMVDGVPRAVTTGSEQTLNTTSNIDVHFKQTLTSSGADPARRGEEWLRAFYVIDDHLSEEYDNQSNPATFWTTGTPQDTSPNPSHTRKVDVTGASAPASTLTGYVALITEANLPTEIWTTALNGGGDLQAYTDSAKTTRIPLEVVGFDTIAQTAQLWVRFPTYSTSDRTVWLFYGKAGESQPAPSSTYGSQSVWQDDELVIHQGTSDDATGNHTPTLTGSPSLVSMMWGGQGYDLGTTSNVNYITIPHSTDLSLEKDYYVDMWRKGTGEGASASLLVEKADSGNSNGFRFLGFPHPELRVRQPNLSSANLNNTNSITTNAPQKLTAIFDGTTRRLYVDNTVTTDTPTGTVTNNTEDMYIGRDNGASNTPFDGVLGTVRIRKQSISTDLRDEEYDNQSNPATFWTTGTPQDATGGGVIDLTSETSEGLNESAEHQATVLLQLASETSEGLNESAEHQATVLLQLASETSEGLNESAEFEATDESVITLIAQTSEGLNESAEHQATVLLQLASETSEGLNESAEHQATVLLQLASETSEGLNESAEHQATVLLQLASETSEGLNESAEFEATDESVITLIAQTSEGLNESAEHQATVLLQLASETSEGLNESAEHQATVLLQLASETSEGLNESADFVVNVLYNLVVLFSQTLNESAIFNVEETGSPDFVAQTSETISQSGVFNVKYIRVDKTLSNLFLIRLED